MAKRLSQLAHNQSIAGSSPAGRTHPCKLCDTWDNQRKPMEVCTGWDRRKHR